MRGTAAAIGLAVLLAAGCESPSGGEGAEKAEKAEKADKAAATDKGGKGSGSKDSASAAKQEAPTDSYAGSGFAVWEVNGRFWVFFEGSKENADFLKDFAKEILPEKHVTRVGDRTLKGPDEFTLDAFEAWKQGFTIRGSKDKRIWIFKYGAKELADFDKGGELAKHVTRIGAGPKGMTIKGPDAETLDAWAASK